MEKALVTKYNGTWKAISTHEYIDQANRISRGLLQLGVQPNDKIAVISSSNRTEWNIMDIGIMQLGAQNVPVYPTISEEEYEYVLNHSESVYCFVSDDEVLQKLLRIKENVPSLKEVYSFDKLDDCKHWEEVLSLGGNVTDQEEVELRKDAIKEDDIATLIYTSGTTGKPKGVLLSHKNLVSNAINSEKRFPISKGKDRALSFCRCVTYMSACLSTYINILV